MKTFLEILDGMERAFFVSAWADAHDEAGHSFAPGTEIMDVAPKETDEAAKHAARTLHFDMVRANGNQSLDNLWQAHPAGYTPREWGHYAAMQAMGHGVGLSDNEECPVIVPYVEFSMASLSRDYF